MTLSTAVIGTAYRGVNSNAAVAFQPPGPPPRSKELEARVEQLEQQVVKKDGVIAWVAEEQVKLKKSRGVP